MESSTEKYGISPAPWTVESLIEIAERVMAGAPRLFSHPESDAGKELNVRLIRDYVVREFIPRPERVGRESRFGREHLIWLLAVRGLLRSQKWSLPAIKASFSSTSSDELLAGLLAPVRSEIEAQFRRAARQRPERDSAAAAGLRTPELNTAQLLVEQFKKQKGRPTADRPSANMRMAPARVDQVPDQSFFQRAHTKKRTHIELEPGCEVVIDAERMMKLTRDDVEQLAEALKKRLRNEIAR